MGNQRVGNGISQSTDGRTGLTVERVNHAVGQLAQLRGCNVDLLAPSGALFAPNHLHGRIGGAQSDESGRSGQCGLRHGNNRRADTKHATGHVDSASGNTGEHGTQCGEEWNLLIQRIHEIHEFLELVVDGAKTSRAIRHTIQHFAEISGMEFRVNLDGTRTGEHGKMSTGTSRFKVDVHFKLLIIFLKLLGLLTRTGHIQIKIDLIVVVLVLAGMERSKIQLVDG